MSPMPPQVPMSGQVRGDGLQNDPPPVRLSVPFSRNLLDLDTFSKSDPSRRHQGQEGGNLGSGKD